MSCNSCIYNSPGLGRIMILIWIYYKIWFNSGMIQIIINFTQEFLVWTSITNFTQTYSLVSIYHPYWWPCTSSVLCVYFMQFMQRMYKYLRLTTNWSLLCILSDFLQGSCLAHTESVKPHILSLRLPSP